MGITTWSSGIMLLSLLILPDLTLAPIIAYSQSGGAAGSGGASPGASQGSPKPRGFKGGPSKPGTPPSDMPGQTGGPRERTQALEQRLRSGQMDQPTAQDQISNRLEQLHGGTATGSAAGTVTDPSTR